MTTYTDTDVQRITGRSRNRLAQLRLGYWNRGQRVDPVLTRGMDWYYAGSRPVYTESGLRIIMSGRPGRKRIHPRAPLVKPASH